MEAINYKNKFVFVLENYIYLQQTCMCDIVLSRLYVFTPIGCVSKYLYEYQVWALEYKKYPSIFFEWDWHL